MSLCFNLALQHEDVWSCGGIAPSILNFVTRFRWLVSFKPWPPISRNPLCRLLFGPPQPICTFSWREKYLPMPWLENLLSSFPARSRHCTTWVTAAVTDIGDLFVCCIQKLEAAGPLRRQSPAIVVIWLLCVLRCDKVAGRMLNWTLEESGKFWELRNHRFIV
jgi:hypothetical protein